MVSENTLKVQRLQEVNTHLVIALQDILDRLEKVSFHKEAPQKDSPPFVIGWCQSVAKNAISVAEEL